MEIVNKSKFNLKLLIILHFILSISCEDDSLQIKTIGEYYLVEDEYYYKNDADVLTDIINLNQLSNDPDYWYYYSNMDFPGSNQLFAYWKNTRIYYLWINDSLITKLPESIGNLNSLEELYIDGSKIESLPDEICNLTYLTELGNKSYIDIDEGILSSLPDSIHQLQRLEHINLENHNLSSLPETIGQLSSLIKLDLTNNNLTTIPPSIGSLDRLQLLHLDDNYLTNIPQSICNLEIRDVEIYLQNNFLCDSTYYDFYIYFNYFDCINVYVNGQNCDE